MNQCGSPSHGQRCRIYVRQLWAVLGVLCLFSQAVPLLHFLAVDHVRCAEHGDWVHAGEAHGPDLNADADIRPIEEATLDASTQHGDHEHCVLCADCPDHAWPGHRSSAVAVWAAESSADAQTGTAQLPAALIYLFAPKTSPPA